MARQDKDGFVDPAVVAAWRRMLWLVRGSAEVVEALVPVAAGMTKEEVSRLLARAGAPSGKGVEPVEQVLGLLGVIPRARYEALLREYQTLLQEYEQLGSRVSEAEQNIERLRGVLREQGGVDEAEELLDSWGGLVRRTLRAQAGFVRSIASAAGSAAPSAPPSGAAPLAEPAEAQGEVVAPAGPTQPMLAQVPEPETDAPPPTPASTPSRARGAGAATTKRPSSRSRTVRTSSSTSVSGPIPAAADAEPIEAPALAAESEPGAPPAPASAPTRAGGAGGATRKRTSSGSRSTRTTSGTSGPGPTLAVEAEPIEPLAPESEPKPPQATMPDPAPPEAGGTDGITRKRPSSGSRPARTTSSTSGSNRAKRTG